MAGQTELELEFGDGAYLFALRLPQILELQRLRGAGIFAIYGRVLKGRYLIEDGSVIAVPSDAEADAEDIFDTIRLGLIGGGKGMVNGAEVQVNPIRARQLVETYCHPAALKESWNVAAAVLHALIEGYDPPQSQKKSAEEQPPKGSTRRKSTRTARPSTSIGED